MKDNKKDALDYHEFPQPGKIAVVPTKKHASQYDLSLAYSPGVAEPCLAIEANKNDAYQQREPCSGDLQWYCCIGIGKHRG